MKPYLLLAFILLGCATKAQFMDNAFVVTNEAEHTVQIYVSKEANVKKYVILASADSINFEVIGAIPSLGNTLSPRTYSYCPQQQYEYYKVMQLDMNGLVMTAMNVLPANRQESLAGIVYNQSLVTLQKH
jgi:hypothetical protein